MRHLIRNHKLISTMPLSVLSILIIAGSFIIKHSYDNHQAEQKIESTLSYNGFSNIVSRSSVRKESTGPFSGISWYEITFSNNTTLKASYTYNKQLDRTNKNSTLKDCPIVYRVILIPPTSKVKEWTTEIYLDTNQKLRDGNQSSYIQKLNKDTRKTLKMKSQDK
ncbi:hypothetical protein [Pediococcus argentinicus]|nr:hypothetical protein [Pediococcus argentinicus]NKZ22941.1 hypothetical protein [Pediococcus argentinicus]GEP20012.1 membrane protein [Pediococcus argentinicus]